MELGEYIYGDIEKNTFLMLLYTNLIKKYAGNIFNITEVEDDISINIKDLLRFADLLSKSTNDLKKQKHNNIAQNIVVLLKELYPENDEVKKIYISVLSSIRNYRGIKENNYFTMNTTEVRLFLDGKIRVPENSILITIDDGARAENFIPILEEYGINATLFLITSWYPVDKFQSNYLEIASHTDNLHSPGICNGGQGSALKCTEKSELLNDLKLSREKLGGTEAFCYPFYEYNNYAIEAVKEAGFKIGFIGEQKKAKIGVDLYKVPRITIHNSTSLNQYINYIK